MKDKNTDCNSSTDNLVFKFDSTATFPASYVKQMMDTTERLARQSGHDNEREEIVCRLLASGMTIDEISLILKIRKDEIRIIESNNAQKIIPEYTRTYKARRKSREKMPK